MGLQIFHIFRNTPLGRETLLQSIHFCNTVKATPVVYIPKFTKFLMYFENDVVQVDLDGSYLTAADSALKHARELLQDAGLPTTIFEPKYFTASTLPDIPTDFDFMCCPRSISDLSSKIGLGYIGPRVRRIVQSARFPVMITSPVFKPWKSIAVFFGGSNNARKALRLGLWISRTCGMPIEVFTQVQNKSADYYREMIAEENLEQEMQQHVAKWHIFESGSFEDNLYEVAHDALVVIGAYGHGVIRDIFFGSKMEKIQSVMPNNLLIAGPNYTAVH